MRKIKSPKRPLNEEITPSLDFTSKVIMVVVLCAGFDIFHLPYAGFVAGVETVGAVELSRNDFALFEEFVDQQSSIPVGGVRMAVGDDVVRRTIEAFAAPFAVKEIEIEAALLTERKSIPLLDSRAIRVFVYRVYNFPEIRYAAFLAQYIIYGFCLFHKEKPF